MRAQRDAERLLDPDGGGERERAAAAERFLQGGERELRLLGQLLTGDAAAGQLLADGGGDAAALFVGELAVGGQVRWSSQAFRHCEERSDEAIQRARQRATKR